LAQPLFIMPFVDLNNRRSKLLVMDPKSGQKIQYLTGDWMGMHYFAAGAQLPAQQGLQLLFSGQNESDVMVAKLSTPGFQVLTTVAIDTKSLALSTDVVPVAWSGGFLGLFIPPGNNVAWVLGAVDMTTRSVVKLVDLQPYNYLGLAVDEITGRAFLFGLQDPDAIMLTIDLVGRRILSNRTLPKCLIFGDGFAAAFIVGSRSQLLIGDVFGRFRLTNPLQPGCGQSIVNLTGTPRRPGSLSTLALDRETGFMAGALSFYDKNPPPTMAYLPFRFHLDANPPIALYSTWVDSLQLPRGRGVIVNI